MKATPKGAIILVDELKLAAGAAELAGEYLRSIMDAETPLGRRCTPKERESLTANRKSMREYDRLAGQLDKVLSLHERGLVRP